MKKKVSIRNNMKIIKYCEEYLLLPPVKGENNEPETAKTL